MRSFWWLAPFLSVCLLSFVLTLNSYLNDKDESYLIDHKFQPKLNDKIDLNYIETILS